MEPKLFKRLLCAPDAFFEHPQDVVESTFTAEEKEQILANWEQQVSHAEESTAEGMAGGNGKIDLHVVQEARQSVAQQRRLRGNSPN